MIELPLWLACVVSLLLLVGGGLALIGTIGMLRLSTFYRRLHAPALATSGGTIAISLASALYFSVGGGKIVLHEVLIALFIIATTPVTLMLLGRAALYRDRAENRPVVAPSDPLTVRRRQE
ncbi:monovalent cation/H(+) antiporter subunit G [Falsirhodobacter sp. alg1]|uniref:monovalent cation/H(+) antiporter subunit G n=1 Tax=Falsirhodobacter sp. alg1 TaxID=1472418 RepID=UPI000787EEEF|nr:monovalent cation/H(+) antiporter subunit G [Falsirhodobacter sp. alg1]